MHRLRELRGVRSTTASSIPLQTSDYRALRQKDFELEEDESEDLAANSTPSDGTPLPHADSGLSRTRLSTLSSITATPWVIHILLILLNLFTLVYLLQKTPSNASCIRSLSSWSLAIDAGVVNYKTIPIGQKNNLYKGHPSSEVDAAWTNITTAVPKLRISATELGKLKKMPTERGLFKDESGYVAQLEVYELLGCLDRLRRANDGLQDQIAKEATLSIDDLEWDHESLDICIDILRVEVMCTSDVDLVTYKEEEEGLRTDFSGVKRCRSFDDILEWSYASGKKVDLSSELQGG